MILNERGEGASEKADRAGPAAHRAQAAIPSHSRLSADARSNWPASLAPDDDRVWLGKANLAIRTGMYDEAERWLAACLGRRPGDAPVWRARLNWRWRPTDVTEARQPSNICRSTSRIRRRVPEVGRLAGRAAQGIASRKQPRPGTADRGRSRRFRRHRPAGRVGDRPGPDQPCRRFCDSKRPRSSGSGPVISSCISGINRLATPPKWPPWRNGSASGSRPGLSQPWRSSSTQTATTFGATSPGLRQPDQPTNASPGRTLADSHRRRASDSSSQPVDRRLREPPSSTELTKH